MAETIKTKFDIVQTTGTTKQIDAFFTLYLLIIPPLVICHVHIMFSAITSNQNSYIEISRQIESERPFPQTTY